jgi:hypothetical protein
MAKLMLIGDVAEVELTSDPDTGGTIATCAEHKGYVFGNIPAYPNGCGWTERYDTLDDAEQYASDHADTGRG